MIKKSTSGRKPKYICEVVPMLRRVPKEKINEIDQAIERICEELKTKNE